MDQIPIKTPNPKYSLYWCLIEFIDWIYSQSCSTPLVNKRPSDLLTGSPPPPPLPVWINTGVCIYTVCGEHLQELYTVYFDQGRNLHTKFLYHPKQKPRRGGGLRQINTCPQVPLQVNFQEKSRHLGLESISYMVHVYSQSGLEPRADLHPCGGEVEVTVTYFWKW